MTDTELLIEIKTKLESIDEKLSNPLAGQYLTPQQVSEALSVSKQTLWTYNKSGILASHRIGGKVLYDKDEVIAAIKKLTFKKH